MIELSLSESKAELISERLIAAGYSANARQQYTSFSKGRGNKVYLTYSRNVIRATVNTEGEEVVLSIFGEPNGKASESQDDKYSTWFFNGYTGKAGSKIY